MIVDEIKRAVVNIECSVVNMLGLGSNFLVIGKIEETHISDNCLTDGKPDDDKIKPFIFRTAPSRVYQTFGEVIGRSNSIGQGLKVSK